MANKRGVKSAAGKAVSSRNAVTHGMTSTLLLIEDESQADLDLHLEQWQLQYPATSEIAERLVIRAALSEWHLLRLERQYNAASSELLANPISSWSPEDHALYKNIQRYLTTAQRTHHRNCLNLRQHRAELRTEESKKVSMETAKAKEAAKASKKKEEFVPTDLTLPQPPFDFPIEQEIRLWVDFDGEPRVAAVPTNEELLGNVDDSFETTIVNRNFIIESQPVVPGYEWLVEAMKKAPPGYGAVSYQHTAKTFRTIAEREQGGPPQRWPDLLAIDKAIIESNVKGPPCKP